MQLEKGEPGGAPENISGPSGIHVPHFENHWPSVFPKISFKFFFPQSYRGHAKLDFLFKTSKDLVLLDNLGSGKRKVR